MIMKNRIASVCFVISSDIFCKRELVEVSTMNIITKMEGNKQPLFHLVLSEVNILHLL